MTLILKSLKTIYNKNMSVEEFLWEFHHSQMLGAHQNILTVFTNAWKVYALQYTAKNSTPNPDL